MRTRRRVCVAFAVLIAAAALSLAAPPQAATPPMGWNSWDCYGTSVTEAQVRANAEYMSKNLRSHGWQYIVVDIQWSEPHPRAGGYNQDAHLDMDRYGRLIPAVNRFPSRPMARAFSRWRPIFIRSA